MGAQPRRTRERDRQVLCGQRGSRTAGAAGEGLAFASCFLRVVAQGGPGLGFHAVAGVRGDRALIAEMRFRMQMGFQVQSA